MIPIREAGLDLAPSLVVATPGPLLGTSLALMRRHLVVGRDEDVDLRLDEPSISRRHALVDHWGGVTYVVDLGSTYGTTVNGRDATSPVELRDGDIVCFASVALRYRESAPSGQPVNEPSLRLTPPPERPAVAAKVGPPPTLDHVRQDVGWQQAGTINNAGHDINTFIQQRESFLREVAGSRTRARHLIVLGFLLSVAGYATYAWAILRFAGSDLEEVTADSATTQLFGPRVGGVPVGLIGFAVAGIGTLLLIVGIVLHIVATARRRRIERDYPMPAPWPGGRT